MRCEINHTSPYWAAMTAPDSHVSCPWISAQSQQMGRNMSYERSSSMPGRATGGCWPVPTSPLMPRTPGDQSTHLQRGDEAMVVTLLLSMPGGDVAALPGRCGGSGQAVPILPLRSCALPQPQQLHPWSHGFAGSQGTCSLLLNCGYRSLNTDIKAQGKPPSTLAKCFEIFFLHKD